MSTLILNSLLYKFYFYQYYIDDSDEHVIKTFGYDNSTLEIYKKFKNTLLSEWIYRLIYIKHLIIDPTWEYNYQIN